ncbi:MAG: PhzF family phenazine biosynthesis protein [Gammaproteobacteria bacterium]
MYFLLNRLGVNEDPVTGSAHCKLAPYCVYLTGEAVTMIKGDILE